MCSRWLHAVILLCTGCPAGLVQSRWAMCDRLLMCHSCGQDLLCKTALLTLHGRRGASAFDAAKRARNGRVEKVQGRPAILAVLAEPTARRMKVAEAGSALTKGVSLAQPFLAEVGPRQHCAAKACQAARRWRALLSAFRRMPWACRGQHVPSLWAWQEARVTVGPRLA